MSMARRSAVVSPALDRGLAALLAVVAAACGARDGERVDPDSPAAAEAAVPDHDATAEPDASEAARAEAQRGALAAHPALTRTLMRRAVWWCSMPAESTPRPVVEAVTFGLVVPFVGVLDAPIAHPPRFGHWHDVDEAITYLDVGLIAGLAARTSDDAAIAVGLGIGLVFADAALARLGLETSPQVRFAIAGAIVRRYIAQSDAPDALEPPLVRAALVSLSDSLEALSMACPSGAVGLRLPAPDSDTGAAAVRAFTKGYADPSLSHLEAVLRRDD